MAVLFVVSAHRTSLTIQRIKSNVTPSGYFFYGSFLLFMFRVYHGFLSVHGSLVVTCCGRANLLALLYVMVGLKIANY